jgi:hypothetical protein
MFSIFAQSVMQGLEDIGVGDRHQIHALINILYVYELVRSSLMKMIVLKMRAIEQN